MSKDDNNRVITVNLDDLKGLVQDGSDIVLQADAEAALLALLELQGRVEGALAEAKRLIEQKALAYNPNFTSVQGNNVKVGYQFFGGKYAIDDSKLDKLPADLYTKKTTYAPVGKAIDAYAKEHGKLPLGVLERERTKSITIKLAKDFSEAE